jgi:tetratricopeptide (TPR) repeat protein
MKGRKRSRARTPDKARSGRLWLWISLALTAVAVGIFAPKILKRSSSRLQTAAAQSETAESATADSKQDRALRGEQLQAVEKLLAEFPRNDDVVYLVGLVHNEQGNSEEAMKLWTRAIELDATRADANESLGYALLLRDDYKGAEKYFRRALEIGPNSSGVRLRLANALSQDGRLEEALAVLEQAQPLSAEGHRLMADVSHQLKKLEKARAHYEAAISLKPNFTEAYYGLSQTLAQLGDAEKSKEFLQKSSVLRKESEEEARRVRAGFDSLAVTRKSVAQTQTDVGRIYGMLGNLRKAEELWLRAAALDPGNELCRLQLAVLNHQAKRYREALRFYEEVVKIDPTDGLAHLNMGNVCLKLNLPEQAERAFKEVIRLEPNRAEGYNALARLLLQANRNLDEAERLAAAAVELEQEARYFAVLGEARAKNGDWAGALGALDLAISLEPGNPQHAQLRQQLLENRK